MHAYIYQYLFLFICYFVVLCLFGDFNIANLLHIISSKPLFLNISSLEYFILWGFCPKIFFTFLFVFYFLCTPYKYIQAI